MFEKCQLKHTGFFCLHSKKNARLEMKENRSMKMSNASMKAAAFKKTEMWKREMGRYEENKQTKRSRGKKKKKKDKDSLYHSNNIIITGDEASRLQVGNISICVLRWTIILWFNGRLFSGTLFGFTNSRHLNVLDFCIKATIVFFTF